MIEITARNPVMPPDDVLLDCGEASYGLGNRWAIDWDRFYDCLENEGWDMQDIGGSIDNQIRRRIRKAVRDGDVQ